MTIPTSLWCLLLRPLSLVWRLVFIPPREEDHNVELLHGSPVQDLTAAGCPQQNVGTYKDGSAIIHRLPIDGESYDFNYNAIVSNNHFAQHPVPAVANTGRFSDYHPHQKIQQSFLAECYLLQETWFANPTCLDAVSHNLTLDSWASEECYFNNISDPR